MSNGGAFPAGPWGGRQHLSLGQAPARAKYVAENWDEAGKRKWHPGLAAREKRGLPAGQVGRWHKQGGGMMVKKANARKEMEASCTSQRGPQLPAALTSHMATGPWPPAEPAKGAGPGMRAKRAFPQDLQPFLPKNVLC